MTRVLAMLPRIGALAVLIGVAGCGDAITSSQSSAPKPPAGAHVTITGTGVMNGALAIGAIGCNGVGLAGSGIHVYAAPPGQTVSLTDPSSPLIQLFVSQSTLTVRIAKGAASTYREREFTGTGVSGFDAAKGAQLSGTLAETTAASTNPGDLPAVASITGSIDCGNQVPGTSTITLSGKTGDGTLTGGLNPVNVACTTKGQYPNVAATGLAKTDTTRVQLLIALRANAFTVFQIHDAAGTSSYYYTSQAGAVSTITHLGGHVNGDAVVNSPTGTYTIHVSGDVVCGSTDAG